MKIHLAQTTPSSPSRHDWERLAAATPDDGGRHRLVAAAEEADVVLFTNPHELVVDWRLRAMFEHEATRRYPEKVYVYDVRDQPWSAFPGLYVSQGVAAFDPNFQVAWAYHRFRDPLAELDPGEVPPRPDLLYSFVGGSTHPVREAVFALDDRRGLVERVDGHVAFDPRSEGWAERRRSFARTMARSRFVLAPRGQGTSSYRVFEAMASGRCPVIISDDWVPPTGPDWLSCSIRWPEREIARLPDYLASVDADWEELGQAARREHETWFAPEVYFQRAMDALESLVRERRGLPVPAHGVRNRGYWRLELRHQRAALRSRLAR